MSLRTLGLVAGLGAIATFSAQAQEPTGDIVDQILNPTTAASPDVPPPVTPAAVQRAPAAPVSLTSAASPPVAMAPPPLAPTPVASAPAQASSQDILERASTSLESTDTSPTPAGWSGFYAGVNVGARWDDAHSNVTTTTTFVNTAALSPLGQTYGPAAATSANGSLSSSESFIGGGEIGYNLPLSAGWMAGVVADLGTTSTATASMTDTVARAGFPNDTVQTTVRINSRLAYFSTLRGRLGYLVDPSLWIYATGGLAIGDATSSTQLTAIEIPNTGSTNINASGHASQTLAGYTVGGGAEWLLDQTWSLKLEYLYYDLGSVSYSNSPFSAFLLSNGAIDNTANSVTKTRFAGSTIRLGVDYHF